MVFFRHKRRRFGRRSKRRFHRRSLRRRVHGLTKAVKGLRRRIEYKAFNIIDNTPGSISVTGIFHSFLNNLTQGTTGNQRIGQKISVHRLSFRYYVSAEHNLAVSTFQPPEAVRVMIIIDKRVVTSGTPPTNLNLYDFAANVDLWMSFRNLEEYSYYKVIYDKRFLIGLPVQIITGTNYFLSQSVPSGRVLQKNIRFKRPLTVEYDFGVNSPIRNAVYLVVWSRSAFANENQLYLRTIFSDS